MVEKYYTTQVRRAIECDAEMKHLKDFSFGEEQVIFKTNLDVLLGIQSYRRVELSFSTDWLAEQLTATKLPLSTILLCARAREITALRVQKDAADAAYAKAVREKALDGLYKFPEVGPGRWSLRDIKAAFHDARKQVGHRRVRGKKAGRTTLSNGRLTRELGGCYGEKISTGRGSHSYCIFFADELVEAVVVALAKKEPARAA